MRQVQTVVDALLRSKAHRATKFMSPTLVVRATRVRWGKRGFAPEKQVIDIRLTIGKPNYRERDSIRAFKRAGEPFPVRKIQLAMLPAPKAKAKGR